LLVTNILAKLHYLIQLCELLGLLLCELAIRFAALL